MFRHALGVKNHLNYNLLQLQLPKQKLLKFWQIL